MNRINLPEKPFIIPFFLSNAGCPRRCIFCNQSAITSENVFPPSFSDLIRLVESHLPFKGPRRTSVELAFYGGSFLGLRHDTIIRLLQMASRLSRESLIDTVRLSTRPDEIRNEHLALIEPYPVSTIEIGVQSMDDRILEISGRGHTSGDTIQAVTRLKEKGYRTGVHLMAGLPGDDHEGAIRSAKKLASLSPDFVRIHPTLVIEGSRLANWYKKGRYQPLTLERAVSTVKEMVLIFREKKIPVIRMGLHPPDDLGGEPVILAGPQHPAFGHLVHSEIFLDRIQQSLGKMTVQPENIEIRVRPEDISRVRGQKNGNISKLTHRFSLKNIRVVPDDTLPRGGLIVTHLD